MAGPCLIGLDLTKQVNLLLIQHEQSSCIQTNKAGDSNYALWVDSKIGHFKTRQNYYSPAYLKAHSHDVRFTHAGMAESCSAQK